MCFHNLLLFLVNFISTRSKLFLCFTYLFWCHNSKFLSSLLFLFLSFRSCFCQPPRRFFVHLLTETTANTLHSWFFPVEYCIITNLYSFSQTFFIRRHKNVEAEGWISYYYRSIPALKLLMSISGLFLCPLILVDISQGCAIG